MEDIFKLGEAQISEASELLASAFFENPLAAYAFPDNSVRYRKLVVHFDLLIRYAHRFGVVFGIGDPLCACVLCLTPGNTDMTGEQMEFVGLDRAADKVGHEEMARFGAVAQALGQCHETLMSEEHWYIQVLGTGREVRGQGYGRELVQYVMSLSDRDGSPCYLSTVDDSNILFYERLGFQQIHNSIEPVSGLSIWAFRRN